MALSRESSMALSRESSMALSRESSMDLSRGSSTREESSMDSSQPQPLAGAPSASTPMADTQVVQSLGEIPSERLHLFERYGDDSGAPRMGRTMSSGGADIASVPLGGVGLCSSREHMLNRIISGSSEPEPEGPDASTSESSFRSPSKVDPARVSNNTVDVRITLDAWPQLVQQLYAAMQREGPQQFVGPPTAPAAMPLHAGQPHQSALAFSPFPRGAPPSAWLPAEVSVEGANGSPSAVVGIVNLAAARTIAQLRPLLSTELTEGALPRQYSFLQSGIEVNSRQEETWPAIALQAGGVRLRPTIRDVGNRSPDVPTGERGRLEAKPSSERSETQHDEACERAPAASAAASAVATTSTGETASAKRLIVEEDREAARARLDGEISSLEQLEKEVTALEFQAFAQRDGSLKDQLSEMSEMREPWARSQWLDDRVCKIECENVLEFAIQQVNQAMEEVPTPSRVAAVKEEVHYDRHTHFEELCSSCGSTIFRAPLDDEARQVMKLAWMLQAVLDYEYHRDRLTKEGAQPEHFQSRVPRPISKNWFGPWRITRVLEPHGDRGIVLKACRASADTVQERAVMLLPRPSADRESVTLTRAEVRSLERATLVSTIIAPSVLQVDATYGVSADLRLGWRFMECLGDHVTTMERALKVQAAAAAADTDAATISSSVAVAAAPTSADEVAKRCHRAVKEGLQLLAALKPLHAKRIVHAALAPRHVAVVRATSQSSDGSGSNTPHDGALEAAEVLAANGSWDVRYKLIGLGSLHVVKLREVDGHRIPERSHAQLPRGVVEYASPEALIEGVPIDER
jgi:hypothetical protein